MWDMEGSDLTLTAHKTVKSRLARHNIGLSVNEIWNASIHTEADKYNDVATDTYRAYGQMRWLVKRGDELNEESVIHADLYESVQIGWLDEGIRTFSCPLYYSDDNVPSRRMRVSSVKKLCDVGYDIDCGKIWARTKSYRNTITSRKYRNVHFDLFIQMKSAKLTFLVMFQGETAARVEAMYPGD